MVSRWPHWLTRFYEEWIGEDAAAAEQAEADEWLRELIPAGSVGPEGLAGFGATVREVR